MKTFYRWLFYLAGTVVLTLGLALNTKTGLGSSAIISVPYCISQLTGLNFGNLTFLFYGLFVVVQLFLRKKTEYLATLLQLPVSLLVSRMLNLYDFCISYDHAVHSLAINLVVLALAIVCTGIGAALTVNMHLVPNPGDGIVQAIAQKIGWEQGLAKNFFDFGCMVCTILIGLLASGKIVGVGLGTVLAMVGIGRVISLTNYLFKEKICRLAGLDGRESSRIETH